ncbi:MAG: hypothetical protein ACQCN6_12745 [Candidatus Bathyarchaeia archaeon]
MEEKRTSHTITGKEKRCNPKKQPHLLAVMRYPMNRYPHTKRKEKKAHH